MVTTAAMVSPLTVSLLHRGRHRTKWSGDREVVSAVSHVGHTLCPIQKSSDTATKGVAELLAALSTYAWEASHVDGRCGALLQVLS